MMTERREDRGRRKHRHDEDICMVLFQVYVLSVARRRRCHDGPDIQMTRIGAAG